MKIKSVKRDNNATSSKVPVKAVLSASGHAWYCRKCKGWHPITQGQSWSACCPKGCLELTGFKTRKRLEKVLEDMWLNVTHKQDDLNFSKRDLDHLVISSSQDVLRKGRIVTYSIISRNVQGQGHEDAGTTEYDAYIGTLFGNNSEKIEGYKSLPLLIKACRQDFKRYGNR